MNAAAIAIALRSFTTFRFISLACSISPEETTLAIDIGTSDPSERPDAVGRNRPQIAISIHLVALKARLFVCAITEWLVRRFSAAT